MNYLAHLFLSHKNPSITLGNLLGDIVKARDVAQLPKDVKQGVDLHRKIDTFTDRHKDVKHAISIIQPYQKRYASVAVDIYFDYLLHQNWETYTDEPIEKFTNWCYILILSNLDLVPESYRVKVEFMARHNWLMTYGNTTELHDTFLRVKNRAKFDNQFEFAVLHLKEHYKELNHYFNAFFPELLKMSRDFMTKI